MTEAEMKVLDDALDAMAECEDALDRFYNVQSEANKTAARIAVQNAREKLAVLIGVGPAQPVAAPRPLEKMYPSMKNP